MAKSTEQDKKVRLLSTINVVDKKFEKFEDLTGVWKKVLGTPTKHGIWLIFGPEKNGKTWFAIMLFIVLSRFEKALYLSAEEGISQHFQDTLLRVGIPKNTKGLLYYEYLEISLIQEVLSRRGAPKIVILDNMTIYADELKNGQLRKLTKQFPDVLFIILAHEESGEPYTATGKMAKRLADVIFKIKGLSALVWGRCPGGEIYIDPEKAQLYHGVKN
jgi:predicted ATP-dependent serine protease